MLQDIQAEVDGRALQHARRPFLHFQLGADPTNRLRQFIGQETTLVLD
jgi:hypothetical protein